MIETIGLSENLDDYLAQLILGKYSPLEIAQIDLILPTRRSCRAIKEAFIKHSPAQSLLLPHLLPLYELDNLEVNIPPALSQLERTLLLSKLCAQKNPLMPPDQAVKMAISLGGLLDEFYQFETDTSRLNELVQNPIFAEHWNETVLFLDIITKVWPSILAERGKIDEVDRRMRLIKAYQDYIRHSSKTIIAAGLDGGIPAIRNLMKTIHHLPNGLVILDGLNTQLNEKDLTDLPDSHYQAGLKEILKTLEVLPYQVHTAHQETPLENLIDIALKPESKTNEWRETRLPPKIFQTIHRIDCQSPQEEALSIAIILRGALEKQGQTAALITPDRQLARRVISEMKRWGITLDDSAGISLPQTEVGIFLNLIIQVAQHPDSISNLIALLKHPLSADGQNPMHFRQEVKSAEQSARQDKTKFNLNLKSNFKSFSDLFKVSVLTPFKTLLSAHIQLAEELATSSDRTAAERLWSSEAGQVALTFITDLLDKADLIGEIEPAFYGTLLNLFMQTQTIRPRYGMHPRLDILGPIEARFHHYDIAILGGLNEGAFPPMPDSGPWLNRTMRQTLHLPQPESKLSPLAMDFAHIFCSPITYLTRSQKADGSETIPSRFLARLEAVAQGAQIDFPVHSAEWAKELDKSDQPEKAERPAPCPPVEARPTSLSVTKIEMWMWDPYSIYARYILNLFPLDPLENRPIQQLYGSAVHKILQLFVQENYPKTREALMELARKVFLEMGFKETELIFYLPRFEQIAQFVLEQELSDHSLIKKSWTEQSGSTTFEVDGKPFTLKGIADRIDYLNNGTYRILDYKTGTPPSLKEVWAGYAPQLPLEAFILQQGGFPHLSPEAISSLCYWKLASQKEECKMTNLLKEGSAEDLIEKTVENLKSLIHIFNNPKTPYEVCPIAGKELSYNDYIHLSRRAEWEHGGDE